MVRYGIRNPHVPEHYPTIERTPMHQLVTSRRASVLLTLPAEPLDHLVSYEARDVCRIPFYPLPGQAQLLLAHRVSAGGYTLVPLKIYFLDGKAKVEIAVAKGKKEYDKRQTLRKKQDDREAQRAMSSRKNLGD